MDRNDLRRADNLLSHWDDVVLGRAPADPTPVGGDVADLIARLQALSNSPEQDSARERVWRELEQHSRWKEPDVDSVFSLNGAITPPLTLPPPAIRPAHPGSWARPLAQAAIALLVVAAIIVGYFSFARQPEQASLLPLVATPIAEGTPAADWPMYKGNPGRTGTMAGPAPDGQPSLLWQFKAQGPAADSPAIAAGVAYLQSADGFVYALDALTGSELWRVDLETHEDTPAIVGNTLFVNDGNGAVVSLNAATGAEQWREEGVIAANTTLVVVDGVIFTVNEDGQLFALDAATGEEQWRYEAGTGNGRSVAVADGRVYMGTDDGSLRAVNATTGEEQWRFESGDIGEATLTPTVGNGMVYVAIGTTLYALEATAGTEQWRTTFDGARTVSLAGTMLISAGLDGVVYALDAATGAQQWAFTTDDRIQAAPAVIGDTIYVASYDQNLYALDAGTGEEQWGYELDGAANYGPSIAGGVIYVSTDLGSLYALGSSGMQQMTAPIVAAGTATPESGNSSAAVPLSSPPTFLWASAGGPEPMYAVGAVVLAPDGNVWAMEAGNGRFQIFAPDGTFVETWDGTGGGGDAFNFAHRDGGFDGDVAFDADGNIYVAEAGAQRVQVFDPDRRLLTSWGESGRENGQFIKPIGLAVDSQGNVYVLDHDRQDIQKFTSSGEWLATFGDSGEARMRGGVYLMIDQEDTIWIADTTRVLALSTDGDFIREIGSRGDGPGQFDEATDVTVDANGVVYVADLLHGWIQVFTTDGMLLAVWDAGRTPSGVQNFPYALAPDNQGNLYVTGVGPDLNSDSSIQKFALPASAS